MHSLEDIGGQFVFAVTVGPVELGTGWRAVLQCTDICAEEGPTDFSFAQRKAGRLSVHNLACCFTVFNLYKFVALVLDMAQPSPGTIHPDLLPAYRVYRLLSG